MKSKLLLTAIAVATTAASAWAQPFFARGDFNGWGTGDPLTEVEPDHYRGTIGGQTHGALFEYKLADENWTQSWPGSNGKLAANANGEMTFHLRLGQFNDGWFPAENRVGYEDPLQHGWEIMGSFNGWSGPVIGMTDMGNGLYSGQYTVPDPGSYAFKFRASNQTPDPWAIRIGDDFGLDSADIMVDTTVANETLFFDLDLPNGR